MHSTSTSPTRCIAAFGTTTNTTPRRGVLVTQHKLLVPRRPCTRACAAALSHRVTITQRDGSTVVLNVPEGTSVLEAAFEANVDLPHDCKMGVCMTCPAKLTGGTVDQSAGMLSEDVQEKGYCLLCVAMPQTDCDIQVIEEEELLNEVMVG